VTGASERSSEASITCLAVAAIKPASEFTSLADYGGRVWPRLLPWRTIPRRLLAWLMGLALLDWQKTEGYYAQDGAIVLSLVILRGKHLKLKNWVPRYAISGTHTAHQPAAKGSGGEVARCRVIAALDSWTHKKLGQARPTHNSKLTGVFSHDQRRFKENQ
jgi:hypothetical protein